MPIIAVCPYCGKGKIRAPENAVGWTAECPNPECGSYFTLNATMKVSSPPSPAAQTNGAAPAGSVAESSSPAAEPSLAAAGTGTVLQDEPTPEFLRSPRPASPRLRRPPEPTRKPGNLPAVAALFLGSAGLACASLPVVHVAAIPLAGAGLVIGLLGILYAVGRETGLALAGLGTTVSAATLVIASWFPGLIDIRQSMPPADTVTRPDRTVMPVGKDGGKPREAAESDWIDASTGAIQLGDVWVRVTSAAIEHVGLESQGQRTLSPEKYLVIRLQLANNGFTRKVDYQTWGPTRSAPSKHRVALTDQNGRTLRQAGFPAQYEVVGAITGGSMFPGKSINDFLIFELPLNQFDFLQLDLNASAFGGEGHLQFLIPKSMIKTR